MTPEPFSTATSAVSSLPNPCYREGDDGEEEEEAVRAYTMGPVLRVIIFYIISIPMLMLGMPYNKQIFISRPC